MRIDFVKLITEASPEGALKERLGQSIGLTEDEIDNKLMLEAARIIGEANLPSEILVNFPQRIEQMQTAYAFNLDFSASSDEPQVEVCLSVRWEMRLIRPNKVGAKPMVSDLRGKICRSLGPSEHTTVLFPGPVFLIGHTSEKFFDFVPPKAMTKLFNDDHEGRPGEGLFSQVGLESDVRAWRQELSDRIFMDLD